jgi:glycosyltransferase involved in cell wall biosynthesis
VLTEAWSIAGLQAPTAALVLVGTGSTPPWVPAGGAVVRERERASTAGHAATGEQAPDLGSVVGFDAVPARALRDFYAAADVLVVPSIPTRTFREPWGLVVNEAMNRRLAVIASDAVGAAAGGLVRDGRNGIVVPAGDPTALAVALRRLAADAELRGRMGARGAEDVAGYTFAAWADGFSGALASVGVSRESVR